jgi:hypothetical protein
MKHRVADDVRTRVVRIYSLAGAAFVLAQLPPNDTIQFGHYGTAALKVSHIVGVAFWGLLISLLGLLSQRSLARQEDQVDDWIDSADSLLLAVSQDATMQKKAAPGTSLKDDVEFVQKLRLASDGRLRRKRVIRFLRTLSGTDIPDNIKNLAAGMLNQLGVRTARVDWSEWLFVVLHVHLPMLIGAIALTVSFGAGWELMTKSLLIFKTTLMSAYSG